MTTPETEAPPALSYPFEAPAAGDWIDVAPGVRWIRLPMPFRLDHINVWAIDDGDGWVLVDTGLNTDATLSAWLALLAEGPMSRPLHGVYVTHMHPDHVGLAGWFTRRANVPLHMSRLEYLSCRSAVADTGREAPADGVNFYKRAGWQPLSIDAYRSRFGGFGKQIHAMPDSFLRLQDGDVLKFGEHEWRVIVGTGHSPEHACLYCAELKLLISGDQVLPRISSNVSVHASEPEADPMGEWYASLDKLKAQLPDDVLVLPAHNDCFHGLHTRLDALKRGQDKALTRLRRTLEQPKRVVDMFGALFARPIDQNDAPLLSMATGEAVACVNYLRGRGEIARHFDDDGVAWYSMKA
ncbi:MBL fold metallo-hydrolase [Ramlibacter albus]|uniref:MBL fold metallo-hydrolase n=1 Tax=Ramlibacter albus TaxID=2079448 RepID=A0A923S7N8_9BURK|nr:MBL fold metallo-hydrolase [Ramlibacter albus]MBC5767302.1 MBL fold metallo-hydrolase [Ramlibacter albus]